MRKFFRSSLVCFLFSLVFTAVATTAAFAQSQVNAADLNGMVTDENGAVLAGVKVVLRNPKTGYTREVTSVADGTYRFLAVPSGVYTVSVEKEGFAKFVSENVELTVGQVGTLDVVLRVGNITDEVVNVTGTQLIETSRTSVAATVNQTAINNLPSNGRSYVNFTLLSSNTTRDNQPSLGPAPTSGLNFGGQRARANNVSIDGADATDNATNGVRATVSQEAVQEFQIQTNSFAAEFGRASSAVINIVTKGGTNNFHGNAFAFLRDQAISANNPFAGVSEYPATRFQGGFTLGGPIKKDRTFFFTSFEATRRNETGFSQIGRGPAGTQFGLTSVAPGALAAAVGPAPALLTPAQAAFIANSAVPVQVRAAYFALARDAANTALTGRNTLGQSAFFTRVPLPGSYVPLNSLVGNYSQYEKTYFGSLRVDHRFNDNNNFFVRGSITPSDVGGTPSNGQNQPTGLNSFSRTGFTGARDFSIVAQNVTTFGANIVNEARFQFARRSLAYGGFGEDVGVEVVGFASFGREPFSPVRRIERRTQATDNVTINTGNHSIKFGVDYNYVSTPLALFEVNFGGIYRVSSQAATNLNPFIAATGVQFPATAPDFTSVQAYGLGIPTNFVQDFGNPNSKFTNPSLGTFIQDSWKIRPNFTLNVGVRYDVEFTQQFAPQSDLSAAAENILGVQQGIPRDYNNVAPRLAIAWDPFKDGKTVLKAAYGLFYGRPLFGVIFLSDVVDGTQSPFLAVPSTLGAINLFQGANLTPGPDTRVPGYLAGRQRFDPFNPALGQQQTLLSLSPVLPVTLPINRKFQYDYTQQANFSIERQIGQNFGLGLTYSFIKGSKLLRPRNLNQGNENLILQYVAAQAGATTPLSPLVRQLGPAAPAGLLIFNAFRPSGPNFAFARSLGLTEAQVRGLAAAFNLPQQPGAFVPFSDVINYESSGSSTYHGLTVNLNKRFSNNYQFFASYTWSKAIDDSTDVQTLQQPQNPRRPDLERANSNFDQRHRFVFNAVIQSPFKRSDGGWNYLLADWTVSPIVELSSGRPYTVYTFTDRTIQAGSDSTARPQVVPLGTPGSFASPDGRFGMALPALGSFGNLGRNPFNGPGYAAVDLRLARKLYLFGAESRNLELIFEAFNMFNRTNISEVLNNYETAGAPAQAFPARQLQFAMKFSF